MGESGEGVATFAPVTNPSNEYDRSIRLLTSAPNSRRCGPSNLEGCECAPGLEYDVVLDTSGTVTVDVHCLPTQALNDHRDLRYALAFDGGSHRVVSVDPDGGEHDPEWQQNVLRGSAIGTTVHDVDSAGTHTLRLWALDPGLVVDRIVVYANGERVTYLGPRETARDG